ncbi:MAG TPA: hypothetical protein VN285_05125, partial [Candidatus Deferrimicrobium sp.]|nr:hypothetical protein [Candidatus Deferrimicrobium sp.]
FLGALPIFLVLVEDCNVRMRQRRTELCLLLDLAILCFLIVMPFSYLWWEKYFLPLVPLAATRLLLLGQTESSLG